MLVTPKIPPIPVNIILLNSLVKHYNLTLILSFLNTPPYAHTPIHIARHTFASLSLSNHVPLESIQKMLGHTDIKTTQIYAKMQDKTVYEDMQTMRDKFNRLNISR